MGKNWLPEGEPGVGPMAGEREENHWFIVSRVPAFFLLFHRLMSGLFLCLFLTCVRQGTLQRKNLFFFTG